jgi:hypothetical protein
MSTLLERKFRLLARLNEELDDHVWSVFGRYIKEKKIQFNSPEAWSVDDNSLFFTGEDGCRGCYDPMTCTIPMEFFTDTEAAFKRLRAEKVEAERQADEARAAAEQAAAEKAKADRKAQFLKLKAEFEGGEGDEQ